MTLKEKRQAAAALPQHPQRALGVPHRELEFLRTDEAAEFLRYQGKHRLRSLYRFLALHGIAVRRRSKRTLLIKKADLVRVLEGRSSRRSQKASAV